MCVGGWIEGVGGADSKIPLLTQEECQLNSASETPPCMLTHKTVRGGVCLLLNSSRSESPKAQEGREARIS